MKIFNRENSKDKEIYSKEKVKVKTYKSGFWRQIFVLYSFPLLSNSNPFQTVSVIKNEIFHRSCSNAPLTSIIAPAHPHATGVAVYPALFFLWEMERVSSNEANVTNPTSFYQSFQILW